MMVIPPSEIIQASEEYLGLMEEIQRLRARNAFLERVHLHLNEMPDKWRSQGEREAVGTKPGFRVAKQQCADDLVRALRGEAPR